MKKFRFSMRMRGKSKILFFSKKLYERKKSKNIFFSKKFYERKKVKKLLRFAHFTFLNVSKQSMRGKSKKRNFRFAQTTRTDGQTDILYGRTL